MLQPNLMGKGLDDDVNDCLSWLPCVL